MSIKNLIVDLTAAKLLAKINREAKRFQETPIHKYLYSCIHRAARENDQYEADYYSGQLEAAYHAYMYVRCVPALVRLAIESNPDLPLTKQFVVLFNKAIRPDK